MYTPPPVVPAKSFVPETARDQTYFCNNPLLTAVQFVPLFVDKNTPPPLLVPAKIFDPETASAPMYILVNPLLTAFQLVPLFVDK